MTTVWGGARRGGGCRGERLTELLRITGVSALGANLVDNLPTYLAMEPVADGSPLRMAALLVGVNVGPLITPWASLVTLLWASRYRAAGVAVQWRTFAFRGLIIMPVLIVAAVAALTATSGTQSLGDRWEVDTYASLTESEASSVNL